MSDGTVYVPRVIEYNDDEPLGVDGEVVGILRSSRSNRRITVLVEEEVAEAEVLEDSNEASEGVEEPTCAGKDGECSRTVDEEGDRCWQHPEEDEDED